MFTYYYDTVHTQIIRLEHYASTLTKSVLSTYDYKICNTWVVLDYTICKVWSDFFYSPSKCCIKDMPIDIFNTLMIGHIHCSVLFTLKNQHCKGNSLLNSS